MVSAANVAHLCPKRLFTWREWCKFGKRDGTNVAASRTFSVEAACAGKEVRMWKKPTIVEIAVGLEINSYACAELA